MSVRGVLVAGLAIVCGLSAAFGVTQLRRTTPAQAKPETVPVVLAAVDLPRGRMITAEDVKVAKWPKNMVPPGALNKVEDAQERSMIVQAVAGELLLDSKLADKDAGRGLAALIPEGMRAYTIQTPRVTSSVAGFVLPGNRVDVLLSLRGNYNDETGGGSTTTLLQSVEILAVGQQLDAPAENKVDPKVLSSVTLLVTPDQAAKLDLGQNMGQLTLALRNPSDKEDARPQPATLADIRFRQEKPVEEPEEGEPEAKATVEPAQEEPEVYRIHTFRGKHRGEILIAPPQRDAR